MKKILFLFVLALLSSVAVIGYSVYTGKQKTASEDPLVWEEDIAALEASWGDAPKDGIVFVGSSSIRLWHTLVADMAPLPVVQQGFGGARVNDVEHYLDRLVLAYEPATVVIFIGTNDINVSDTPASAVPVISSGVENIVNRILAQDQSTQIFYIAITPTIMSWTKWAEVQQANAAVQAMCELGNRCQFIATADLFLDEAGEPNKKLYQFDGLHLSQEGYALWTARIKPLLTPD
jgi:lysophospholipase L1-like esterase